VSRTLRVKLRRDIARSWPLFASLAVTVLLGVGLFAASFDAYRNLAGSYDHAFSVQSFPDLFVTGGDVAAVARSARATDGVAAVRTRTVADLPMRVTDPDGVTDAAVGRIVSYPTSGAPEVASLTPIAGAGNPSPGAVLVEQHLAESFGLTPGDALEITGAEGPQQVTIAGVVASAEYLWPAPSRQQFMAPPRSFGVMYVTPQDAATWSGSPDNQALVRLSDPARATGAPVTDLRTVAVAHGATEVLTRAEQPSNALLHEDILGFQQMAVAFPMLFLSAAALVLFVLLTRRVAMERPIIGTLRAFGTRGARVGWHYLSYGLAAGLVGAAIGLPLGLLAAGAMSREYAATIDLPESLMVYGGLRLDTIGMGLAFALGMTAVAGAIPAYRATRIAPAEAMRPAVPRPVTRRGLVDRALPGRASSRAHYTVRSITRHRARTVFTATGVALAFILVLASWGMIDTMTTLLGRQFDEVDTSDARVTYGAPIRPGDLAALTAVPGVAQAEAVIDVPVGVRHRDATYATAATGLTPGTTMHGFFDTQRHRVSLPAEGVLLGRGITEKLPGLVVGDQVDLVSTAGGRVVRARVAGFVDEPLGTFAYADQQWLARQFGVSADSALLRLDPAADVTAVRGAVQDLPGVATFTETSAIQRLFQQYAGLFLVFGAGMLALGAAMAFAVVFTTMSVSLLERRRELATLRAAGVSQRTLAGLVSSENMLVAALGILPGLALGLAAADAMMRSYSSDQFSLDLTVKPLTLALSTLAVMSVAALCQFPVLRAIRRMDVAEVVRERE
jgi:putative ABC transport system permease protein